MNGALRGRYVRGLAKGEGLLLLEEEKPCGKVSKCGLKDCRDNSIKHQFIEAPH